GNYVADEPAGTASSFDRDVRAFLLRGRLHLRQRQQLPDRVFLDGLPANCDSVAHAIDIGSAVPCPGNNCGAQNVGGQLWVFNPSTANVQSFGLGMFSVTYMWGQDLGVIGQTWNKETKEWEDVYGSVTNTTTETFFAPGSQVAGGPGDGGQTKPPPRLSTSAVK
ncbi:MAG: hypothetical protein DMF66_14410, partial [Acidobacteria bacterium]